MSRTYQRDPHTKTLLNHLLDTPWRYRCPECDSTGVVVREPRKAKAHSSKRYSDYEPSIYADKRRVARFFCNRCNTTFDEPYDAKHDEQRFPDGIERIEMNP